MRTARMLSVFTLLIVVAGTAVAMSTGFTYQGKLTDSAGAPVSGFVDFRFSLWNAATLGTQIGSVVSVDSVRVSGGLFTVPIDFGSTAFTGGALWLEVEVRTPSGSGSYSLLGPRQEIKAVPYAVHARSASAATTADTVDGLHASAMPTANTLLSLDASGRFPLSVLPSGINADLLDSQHGSFYQNASNLNAGTLADARLSPNVALLGNTQTFTGAKTFSNTSNSFTGNASGLTNLNATNLTTGTVADARLSTNVALLDTAQTFSANKYFTGNVAIGSAWAGYPLYVLNPLDHDFATTIYALSTATGSVSQQVTAVHGEVRSTRVNNAGSGVLGLASSASGNSAGVRGETASTGGTGVFAWATAATGSPIALRAACSSPTGYAGHFSGRSYFSDKIGVGIVSPERMLHILAADSTGPVIYGVNNSGVLTDSPAIEGVHNVVPGWGIGVKGVGGYYGVSGDADIGTDGHDVMGVRGYARSAGSAFGVSGIAQGTGANYGVYASASGGATNYAGYFGGNVTVTGILTAGSKSFKIDHPLDPENKTLAHACVEAPEMLNVYSGNVVTDGAGYATVRLPDYFEALNSDLRYQLTVVDGGDDFVIAKVAREVQDGQFTVRTSRPFVKVSWQVTGVRIDKWAQQNPLAVEQDKAADDKGKYIHPEAFGNTAQMGIGYVPPSEEHNHR